MSVQVPSGFDWADGVSLLPLDGSSGTGTIGTPAPDEAVLITDASGTDSVSFNENSDSPIIERAEQCTIKHEFETSWYDAYTRSFGLGLGTILFDSFGNESKVLSATYQRTGAGGLAHDPVTGAPTGGSAKITVIAEALSFDTPPDEFSIEAVDLGLNIIKNPRYFYALYPTDGTNPNYPNNDFATTGPDSIGAVSLSDGSTCSVALIKQQIIRAIQTYQDSPFFPSANQVNSLIQNQVIASFQSGNMQITDNSGTTLGFVMSSQNAEIQASLNLAFATAGEIVQKLWNQEDNPPLSGYKITWSRYYFKDSVAPVTTNPELYFNPGSYIEDPIYDASPALPDYFGSTCGDYSVDTIFDNIAFLNPQAYSLDGTEGTDSPPPIYGTTDSLVSISWLRQADVQEYQRTWFKVTRSWIGSPIGHWDFQIFSNGDRPAAAIDYLPLAN